THMFATLSQRYHIGVVATGRIECGKMPNALTRPPTDTVTLKTERSCKSVGDCADIGLSGSDCQRTSNVTQAAYGRLSAFDSDDVRLNLAVDRTRSEPLGDSFGCDVGCFAEPRFVARLDLVSQWCPLAVCDRRNLRRCRLTTCRNRIEMGRHKEPAVFQVSLDGRDVVVTVWRARQEARRILGEKRF